jgi:predicted alpha/beta superfamily hydrolase
MPEVSISHTEVHSLRSRHVESDFELWIAHPVAGVMPLPPGPKNVLYVLDANLFFGTAVEMTRIMAQLYGELPPLVVVGIAYPTEDPALQAELRARDFTPTADAGFAEMARNFPGAREPSLPEGRRLGGASGFRGFLRSEVVPFVESRVDLVEGGSTIFGSSLGGLFVVDAFLEDPGLFDAYIATSPGLWWGNEIAFEKEEERAAAIDDIEAKIVLAVGALEENPRIPMLAQFKMVTNVHRLEKRLRERGYPSLEIWKYELEGESHTSVVPVSLTRGLRAIYGAPRRQS